MCSVDIFAAASLAEHTPGELNFKQIREGESVHEFVGTQQDRAKPM